MGFQTRSKYPERGEREREREKDQEEASLRGNGREGGGRRGGGERGSKWNKSTFEVSEFRTLKGERPSSSTSVSLSKILYFRFIFILFFVSFFLSFFLSTQLKERKKKKSFFQIVCHMVAEDPTQRRCFRRNSSPNRK